MSDVTFASFGKFALSAGLLASVLYAVHRGGSLVANATKPADAPADVGIPLVGIPNVTTDMVDLLQNQPQGTNNSAAPHSDNTDSNGLLFDQHSLYQEMQPILPAYVANVRSMI